MVADEVFVRPTVKRVIFEIRFPNLFYMESKIGDLQLKIMKEFPESALVFRRQVVFADLGPAVKDQDVAEQLVGEPGRKIWQFKSPQGFQLNVLGNSLNIASNFHKSYSNPEAEHRFRDVIEFVLDNFLEVMRVPALGRVGLRYINECPVPRKDTDTFREYYDSVFPLGRFALEDATELLFRAVVARREYSLRYSETLRTEAGGLKLIIDLDAFTQAIESKRCLSVVDDLHKLIRQEFLRTIREPVIEYMRGKEI